MEFKRPNQFKRTGSVLSWKQHSTRHATTLLSQRNLRSKVRWFTELCNSHYVSHFAAFFIDTRAERSTVESRHFFVFRFTLEREKQKRVLETNGFIWFKGLGFFSLLSGNKLPFKKKGKEKFGLVHSRFVCFWRMHVNDPSAGSPTETLLRLLLPLNGKVWTTSLAKVTSELASIAWSDVLTGPFNR
jgi:hypothetical protein